MSKVSNYIEAVTLHDGSTLEPSNVSNGLVTMTRDPPPAGAPIILSDEPSIAKTSYPKCSLDQENEVDVTVKDVSPESHGKTSARVSTRSLTAKLLSFLESQTCTVVLVVIFILNALQLIVFFVFYLVIEPSMTARKLNQNDIGFMTENLPDALIDYGYFESLSVL